MMIKEVVETLTKNSDNSPLISSSSPLKKFRSSNCNFFCLSAEGFGNLKHFEDAVPLDCFSEQDPDFSYICPEAGVHAVRKNRYVILPKDFEKGYQTNVKNPDSDFEFYK